MSANLVNTTIGKNYTPLSLEHLQGMDHKVVNKELADVNKEMYERNVELAVRNRTLSVLRKMYEIINTSLGLVKTAGNLIDEIVKELKFEKGFIAIADHRTHTLRSIAVSTSPENLAKRIPHNKHPFKHFEISLRNKDNFCALSIQQNQQRVTNSLYDVLVPMVSPSEAQKLQEAYNIQTSVIYPIVFANKVLGVLVLCLDKHIGFLSRAEVETLRELIEVVAIAIERSQIYIALKKANSRLKELDQLKDELVSVASHELRTPMTAIKSYLWMAINGRGGEINEKQKYYLDRAYMSTDRLIKLVNDMLNVSRIEAGRVSLSVEKVDIDNLADEVIAEVKPRADELGLHIRLKKPETKLYAIADVDKIKEVLINLLGNSLKFTPRDGIIEIYFEEKDGMVNTNVKDNGKGVEKDDQEKLFQKFGLLRGSYTTNQTASQGTGLGLYICKSIVQLHKGQIWAASEGRDKGSVFSFSLKAYNEKDFKILRSEQDGKEGKEIIHTGL